LLPSKAVWLNCRTVAPLAPPETHIFELPDDAEQELWARLASRKTA
jgi:hypothetical protein